MVTNPYFAIGDLQGCLESLDGLLEQLPEDAPLIFLGDLVNRGPESLATLRRVAGLGSRARCLLGNHDLHLLAVAAGASKVHKKDTIGEIFEAPDADELIEWLRHQSIMIETEDAVFVHAGVHPLWTLEKARGLAREAEAVLSGPDWKAMLQQMYGNSDWDDGLKGGERMQAILNCFTRMRFVDKKTAELDFKQKEDIGSAPKHLIPHGGHAHLLRPLVHAGPHPPRRHRGHRHGMPVGREAHRRALPRQADLSGGLTLLGRPLQIQISPSQTVFSASAFVSDMACRRRLRATSRSAVTSETPSAPDMSADASRQSAWRVFPSTETGSSTVTSTPSPGVKRIRLRTVKSATSPA